MGGSTKSPIVRCPDVAVGQPMVPFWGPKRCTTHFSGDWDFHWQYWLWTNGHVSLCLGLEAELVTCNSARALVTLPSSDSRRSRAYPGGLSQYPLRVHGVKFQKHFHAPDTFDFRFKGINLIYIYIHTFAYIYIYIYWTTRCFMVNLAFL